MSVAFCAAGIGTSRNLLSSLSSGRKRQTSSKSASCARRSDRSSKSNSKSVEETGSAEEGAVAVWYVSYEKADADGKLLGEKANQVAILAELRPKGCAGTVIVGCTHLMAKKKAEVSALVSMTTADASSAEAPAPATEESGLLESS